MILLLGFLGGAFSMLFFIGQELKPIQAFGRCLEEKTDDIDGYFYLPMLSVSDCYFQTLK